MNPRSQTLTLIATILGSAIVFVDGTVVNVALPALADDLGERLRGSALDEPARVAVAQAKERTLDLVAIPAGCFRWRCCREAEPRRAAIHPARSQLPGWVPGRSRGMARA